MARVRMTMGRLRALVESIVDEAERPQAPSRDTAHLNSAQRYLDDAVRELEQLSLTRPDVTLVVDDVIDAVHRAQVTLDRLGLHDSRFSMPMSR